MPNPSGSVRAAQRLRRARAKTDSPSLWRRAAAVLTTLALAGGLAVVGAAAPASAHHNDIVGVVACNTETGKFDITWTVQNSQSDRSEKITKSSNLALVPVGTEIGKGAKKTFVQADAKAGTSYTLTLSAEWYDSKGKVAATQKDAKSNTVKPSGTCAKSFDYDWEYAAPTCDALTVVYPSNIPSGQANDVNVRIIADGTSITLNFHNNTGTWSGTKVFTFADHKDWPKPDTWVVEWVQVAGSDYHWQGKLECGESAPKDKITVCHWDAKKSAYEKLALSVSELRLKHSLHKKDIHPAYTYTWYSPLDIFKLFPQKKAAAAQGDQELLNYVDCVKPPAEVAVNGTPSGPECVASIEDVNVPSDIEGLVWSKSEADGVVTVSVAAASDKFVLTGELGPWTFDLDANGCEEPPAEVAVNGTPSGPECVASIEDVNVPSDIEGLVWSKSEADGVVTVSVAAASDKFVLTGELGPWTFDLDANGCEEPPAEVAVNGTPSGPECVASIEDVNVPSDIEGLVWSKSEADGVVTVSVAAASDKFVLTGELGPWTFDLDANGCEEPPAEVAVNGTPSGPECVASIEDVNVPSDIEGLVWSKSEADGVVTVSVAAASDKFVLTGELGPWTFDLDANGCEEPPAEVAVNGTPSGPECVASIEDVNVPSDIEGLVWSKSEADGVVTVSVAAASDKFVLTGELGPWTFDLDADACEEPAPPVEPEAATLEGSVATGECDADVPWITYSVKLTDPDNQATSDRVTLTLSDGTESEVLELGALGDDDALSGRILWPGAAVDDEGNASGWPGWEQKADGTWQETDGNFAWTRSITSAVIHVNPDLSVALSYPLATPDCATAPIEGGSGGGEAPSTTPPTTDDGNGDGDTTTVTAESEQSGLASTGFAGTAIAIVAGIIVLAGAAFLVIARVRRKRA